MRLAHDAQVIPVSSNSTSVPPIGSAVPGDVVVALVLASVLMSASFVSIVLGHRRMRTICPDTTQPYTP
ncbi:hypothetical protein [Flexivirga lutea]